VGRRRKIMTLVGDETKIFLSACVSLSGTFAKERKENVKGGTQLAVNRRN